MNTAPASATDTELTVRYHPYAFRFIVTKFDAHIPAQLHLPLSI
jgi:hypothetical protein